jgi:hypothetical protein
MLKYSREVNRAFSTLTSARGTYPHARGPAVHGGGRVSEPRITTGPLLTIRDAIESIEAAVTAI